MPPYSSRILVVNDGSFKLDLNQKSVIKSVESNNSTQNDEIDNEEIEEITLGKYRHFKGNVYDVIGFAKHSETGEKLVIYRSVENPDEVWARPYKMFAETIGSDGQTVKRFTKI